MNPFERKFSSLPDEKEKAMSAAKAAGLDAAEAVQKLDDKMKGATAEISQEAKSGLYEDPQKAMDNYISGLSSSDRKKLAKRLAELEKGMEEFGGN